MLVDDGGLVLLRSFCRAVRWIVVLTVAGLIWEGIFFEPMGGWRGLVAVTLTPQWSTPVVYLIAYLYFGAAAVFAFIIMLVPYVIVTSVAGALLRWWRRLGTR